MLDQNTDRTWYMIGAVILGSVMVAAAKVAFPEVFSQVIVFFKSMIPTTLGMSWFSFFL